MTKQTPNSQLSPFLASDENRHIGTFVRTTCIEVWREDVLVHEARKSPISGIN
jgi:hypothetical protein